jgi:hypothetical protein
MDSNDDICGTCAMRLLLETAQKAEARGRQKAFAEAWDRCPRTTLSNSLTAVVLDDFRGWLADGAQKVADEPATKPTRDATIRRDAYPVLDDGLAERELDAWELYLADTSTRKGLKRGEWSELTSWEQAAYLSMRDRAEQLFKAKADERVIKRLQCLRDEHKESQVELMRTLSQVQAERTAAYVRR